MIDLLAEFVEQAAAATRRDLDALGAPVDFLWHGPARVGVAVIEPCADGTYQPIATGGELAYVVPLIPLDFWIADNDPVDLIAWRPSRPDKWWLRFGIGQLLNPDAVLRAEIMREPLEVYSTPLAWLRSGGRGTVILDWRCNLRFHLGGIEHGIVADTPELAEVIERRLRAPACRTPDVSARKAA